MSWSGSFNGVCAKVIGVCAAFVVMLFGGGNGYEFASF
jgi:hypothetical protein